MSRKFRFANGKLMEIDVEGLGDGPFTNWASFIEYQSPLTGADPRLPVMSIGVNVEGNHGLRIKELEYDLAVDEELQLKAQTLRVYKSRVRDDLKLGSVVGNSFNANGFFGGDTPTEEIVDSLSTIEFEETPEGGVVHSELLEVSRCLGSLMVRDRGFLEFLEGPLVSRIVPDWAGARVEVGEVWNATPSDQDHESHSHYLMATPDFVAMSYPISSEDAPADVRSGHAIGEVFSLLTTLEAR